MKPITRTRRFDAVTFGEVMMRLSPNQNERLSSCLTLRRFPGGSELNIAAGLSMLGMKTAMVTRLPQDDTGRYIRNAIISCGVHDDFIIHDEDHESRVGIYFYENGAFPRKPQVLYDRRHSAINTVDISEVAPETFESASLFHTSGISLAISRQARTCAVEMMRRFKKSGALISFDVNYRANLWSEDEARETICSVLPLVDILFVSEETLRRTFGQTGTLRETMRAFSKAHNLAVVASTERTVISPKCHNFTSTVYDSETDSFFNELPYEGIDVIDRVGSGDAYVAGALYGLLSRGDCGAMVRYGNAMSAIKSTVEGDLPSTSLKEAEAIIAAHEGIGPQSE
ncbi:MAG: sugar kinase, partial [Acetanaerobacterium sp.]